MISVDIGNADGAVACFSFLVILHLQHTSWLAVGNAKLAGNANRLSDEQTGDLAKPSQSIPSHYHPVGSRCSSAVKPCEKSAGAAVEKRNRISKEARKPM